MSKIPVSMIPPTLVSQDIRNKKEAAVGNFDALLLNNESSSSSSFVSDFLDKIVGSKSFDIGSVKGQTTPANKFPFTPSFVSTFGTSGPLPAYITMMTTKLKWSASQNQAFQEIAVNNKDATWTKESMKKIATELKAAGFVNNAPTA